MNRGKKIRRVWEGEYVCYTDITDKNWYRSIRLILKILTKESVKPI
ncbi:hypothetical protein ICE98_01910 [Lactococcus lactis]|nr:hypothetical protein [Lactococcus lactis]